MAAQGFRPGHPKSSKMISRWIPDCRATGHIRDLKVLKDLRDQVSQAVYPCRVGSADHFGRASGTLGGLRDLRPKYRN